MSQNEDKDEERRSDIDMLHNGRKNLYSKIYKKMSKTPKK